MTMYSVKRKEHRKIVDNVFCALRVFVKRLSIGLEMMRIGCATDFFQMRYIVEVI